jgi:hypothetical protein
LTIESSSRADHRVVALCRRLGCLRHGGDVQAKLSAPAAGRSDPDPSDAIRRVDLVNVLQPLKPEERSQDRD